MIQRFGELKRPSPTGDQDDVSPTNLNAIVTAAKGLKYQTTSMDSDEALCLADLLGCEIGPIVQESSADSRMIALSKQLVIVPFALAFRRGERLKAKGFTWASKTLLRPASEFDAHKTMKITFNGDVPNHGEAQVSDEGLRFACRGHELQKAFKADISGKIVFETEVKVWHEVQASPYLDHKVSYEPPTR